MFSDVCNLKPILAMIIRINYFRRPFWFSLMSIRSMAMCKLLLPPSSSSIALQVIWGSLVSAAAYSFIFESLQLNEFSTDLQDSGL